MRNSENHADSTEDCFFNVKMYTENWCVVWKWTKASWYKKQQHMESQKLLDFAFRNYLFTNY